MLWSIKQTFFSVYRWLREMTDFKKNSVVIAEAGTSVLCYSDWCCASAFSLLTAGLELMHISSL